MQHKACALVGHCPTQIPIGQSAQTRFFAALQAALETALRDAIAEGCTVFRSGSDGCFGRWITEAVARLQAEQPHLRLHFVPPNETLAGGAQILIVCHDRGFCDSTADAMRAAAGQGILVRNIYSSEIRALVRPHGNSQSY